MGDGKRGRKNSTLLGASPLGRFPQSGNPAALDAAMRTEKALRLDMWGMAEIYKKMRRLLSVKIPKPLTLSQSMERPKGSWEVAAISLIEVSG